MTEGARICTSCNIALPLARFETFNDGKFRGVCRDCTYAQRARKMSASPEAFLKTLMVQLKSARRNEDIAFTLTADEVCELWEVQAGKCALSGVLLTYQRDGKSGDGKKKEFNASLDRINPGGPYSRENVQLVAGRVNTMKHTLGEDMFIWWIKNIHEHFLSKMRI